MKEFVINILLMILSGFISSLILPDRGHLGAILAVGIYFVLVVIALCIAVYIDK